MLINKTESRAATVGSTRFWGRGDGRNATHRSSSILYIFYAYLALLMGFVPYRQIIRTDFLHVSFLEIVKAALLGLTLLGYWFHASRHPRRRFWTRSPLNKPYAAVILAFGLALIIGLLSQPSSEWNKVFRMAAVGVEYGLFFVLLRELSTRERVTHFLHVVAIYAVIATGFVAFFQMYPAMLPPTSEMGVLRFEAYGGFKRVFTPGSGLIFSVVVGLLGYLLWPNRVPDRRHWWLWPYLAILAVALITSFVRSNFVIVIAWTIVLLLIRGLKARSFARLAPGLIVSLVVAAAAASVIRSHEGESLASAFAERTLSIARIASGQEPNTLASRRLELAFASDEIRSGADHLFGLGFGHSFRYFNFTLPEEYESTVTHNGYFSIYYSHGIFGTTLFLAWLVAVSHRLWTNYRAARHTSWGRIQVAVVMVWLSLLVANFQSPILQTSETVILVVLASALSERVKILLRRGHNP